MAVSPVSRSAPAKTPPPPAERNTTPPPPPPPPEDSEPEQKTTTASTSKLTTSIEPTSLTSVRLTKKPTEPTPQDAAPKDAVPTDATPTDATPTDAAPTNATPTDATPTDKVPTEATPTDEPPTDATPTDAAPSDTTPTDPSLLNTSLAATPSDVAPADATPTTPSVSLASTAPTDETNSGLPPGIDLTKAPPEVQDISERAKDIVKKNGADILQEGIDKLKIDRSFENPKTIGTQDLSKLTDVQRAAYYIDLKQASDLNTFLDDHYGDNLFGTNLTTGATAAQPGHGTNTYPGTVVGDDINARLKKLEDLGVSQSLGNILNNHVGDWIKGHDQATYRDIQAAFDNTLFGAQAALKHDKPSITDSLTSLNTTALLAQTYLAKDDFAARSGDLSTTYNAVVSNSLQKSAQTLGDFSLRNRGAGGDSSAPPPGASQADYDKWFNSLSDDSASRRIQPIVQESFDASNTAKQLAAAGIAKDSDVWNEYKDTFVKDTTSTYNNYWGNIRRGVKMDGAFVETQLPNGERVVKSFANLSKVAGVDVDAYKAGVFHTVQNATLSAAIAGSILAGQDGSDPKSAMTLTYAATNMADVIGETASKYLDAKNGLFTKLGLNKGGSWTTAVQKYLPGGDFQTIGGATKILAGAGQVIGGAAGIWNAVDAAKRGDAPAAALNSVSAVSNVVAGLATGAEGALQYTNIVKNLVSGLFPGVSGITPSVIDAAAKSALAGVGWAAGLVGGLALTAFGIYDMAKGVKVLDKSLSEANDKLIAPTTGWSYEFLMNPDPGGPGAAI